MKRKRRSTSVMFYESRGVWVASWYCDGGQRRTMRLPTANDRDTAQAEFQGRRAAAPEAIAAPPPTSNSIQALIDTFERQVMPSYRAATRSIYRQLFGLLAKAGMKNVSDFRADKLRSLTDVLITENMGVAQRHKMLRATRHFMRWSHEVGFLATVPKIGFPRVQKKSKGRPLTEAEFQAMLTATDTVYHLKPERAEACKRTLTALRLSGLRIGEADLSWDDREGFHVDWTSHERPVFVMPDTIDKTGESRVFPMTPDFWAFISTVPESERTGPVFSVLSTWRHQRLNPDQLSKLIQRIGKASGVVVSRKGVKVKYASAHDLRRSFGLVWAQKVNLIQLCALMRHRDPKTTQTYYLGIDASRLLDGIW